MEIRVRVKNGRAIIETISALEDLWHDFEYFKARAVRLESSGSSRGERLKAKRYQRAAIVMLAFYFEGVINQWLIHILRREEFDTIERRPIDFKVQRLLKEVGKKGKLAPHSDAAKRLRNELAHLKPGHDLMLFDQVSGSMVAASESTLVGWLTEMEQALGVRRHPNTEAESRDLRAALGQTIPGSEGYTGHKARR